MVTASRSPWTSTEQEASGQPITKRPKKLLPSVHLHWPKRPGGELRILPQRWTHPELVLWSRPPSYWWCLSLAALCVALLPGEFSCTSHSLPKAEMGRCACQVFTEALLHSVGLWLDLSLLPANKEALRKPLLPPMFLGRSRQILGKFPSPFKVMLSGSRWATWIRKVL